MSNNGSVFENAKQVKWEDGAQIRNRHRYDLFGRHASSRLIYMGGKQLYWGVRLIILMLIVGKVDIPVAEVEMMKTHPAWDAVFVFLIAWCVFWFLDRFIAHFLNGYTQQYDLFYYSMLGCFKDNSKICGMKKTSLQMKHAVSFENYLRRHPSFRRKVDSLNAIAMSGNLSYEEYNERFAKLFEEEGLYLKKGWKVCRVRKRNRKSSSTE